MRFGVMGDMEAMSKNRCYSELIHIPTFEERFEYLKLDGVVGIETFGFDRYLNQRFYHSKEWLVIRITLFPVILDATWRWLIVRFKGRFIFII